MRPRCSARIPFLRGRNERGTAATAGKTFPFEPSEDPSKSGSFSGSFLQKACADGIFIAGVLRQAADELQDIIDEGFVPATGIVALASGLGPAGLINPITDYCLILKLLVEILRSLADDVEASGDVSLTQVVNSTIASVMNNPDIPRPVATMTIRTIFLLIFESQQKKRDFVVLSFAVMDTHDHKDWSCFGNAESIEVSFDARRPNVYCTYVDQILAFEARNRRTTVNSPPDTSRCATSRVRRVSSRRRDSKRLWSSKWRAFATRREFYLSL